MKSKGQRSIKASNKKKKKDINRLNTLEIKDETKYSKYSLGIIKYAELHQKANKPMKQLEDLTEEDIKKYSCPCCGLPAEIKGKLEPFKTCDNPDELSNSGQGVVLYFSFIKFVVIISIMAMLGIGFFNNYIAYYYYCELRKICNDYYQSLSNEFLMERDWIDKVDYRVCAFYFKEYGNDKDSYSNDKDSYGNDEDSYGNDEDSYGNDEYSYGNEYDLIRFYKIFNDSFFFKFSTFNIMNYEQLYYELNKKSAHNYTQSLKKKKKFMSSVVDLDFTHFLCLITILIFNLVYIFYFSNKSNASNCLVYSVSNYSVFLTNLFDIYEKFKNNLEYIKKKEIENNKNKNKKKLNKNIYLDKLGFEPEEGISQLDLFKKFLEKKIFQKESKEKNKIKYYEINRIDLCYKLEEILKMQKLDEELNEKIERIELNKDIIEKNKKKARRVIKGIFIVIIVDAFAAVKKA